MAAQSKNPNFERVKSGSRVGRLTVQEVVGKSKNGSAIWSCICDCGNSCDVISSSLNSKLKRSCGCYYDETRHTINKTHGNSTSREYHSWTAMRQRCYNPNTEFYHCYGERGIIVCDEWRSSFEKFYKDMGDCPEGFLLDRVDVNGNYTPDNCRWVNASISGYNTKMSSNNTSGQTGVYFYKDSGRWSAYISYHNKQIGLGSYANYEDAVRARLEAEIEYFGFNK